MNSFAAPVLRSYVPAMRPMRTQISLRQRSVASRATGQPDTSIASLSRQRLRVPLLWTTARPEGTRAMFATRRK